MASSVNCSLLVQSGSRNNQKDVMVIMKDMEVLLKENESLDKRVDSLMIKKKENSKKISGLVVKVKRMGVDYDEVMEGQEDDDESPEGGNLTSLRDEEVFLIQRVEESTRNLMDHEKLLQDLEEEGGQNHIWYKQFENVMKFRAIHKMYKESKEMRLKAIRHELRIEHVMESGAGTSRGGRGGKKVLKEKFITKEAVSDADAGPSSSKNSFASKRKLNEVVDCGLIPKKISQREKDAMVPTVLKREDDSPPNPYQCNFCRLSFTSAAPLVIHLEKHYAKIPEKLECPFSNCGFSANEENLTRHVRAKHTKEQLFTCSSCPIKFHTMHAKMSHEKKHSQPTVWAQCGKAACLRFYQLAKGSCRCGKK
eukprot:GFUD01125765.1.p1 GENE.GFUD01125765.1~~GFUD01125765.1.p1  ORF type:complete len:366 (-),score=117.76 GFUD01125765.1:53-1150(-)